MRIRIHPLLLLLLIVLFISATTPKLSSIGGGQTCVYVNGKKAHCGSGTVVVYSDGSYQVSK